MNQEIKELLKEEIKATKQSKISVIIGIVMIILDIILVVSSVINIYSLLFVLPLTIIVRKQFFNYRINSAVLILTRYIIDDEFQEEFDKENNLK